MTYLTVPISASTPDEALSQASAAKDAGAQMVELRTDYLENLTVDMFDDMFARVLRAGIKTIVTCRDSSEGGQNDYPRKLRIQILARAAHTGADFVDCEYANFTKPDVSKFLKDALESSKTRLILSAHNFKTPFKDIEAVYDGMLMAYPDAVPKVVYTAKHVNDCFAAFGLLHRKDRDAIVLAMGEHGLITRILAKKFGSLVCFACLDEKTATAPGQVSIAQMKNLYRYDSMNSKTQVFGIIGSPVSHSKSPAIHNACFGACNMNRVYVPILLKGDRLEFNRFMENVKDRHWLNFGGFSVTIPHKENALAYTNHIGGFAEEQASKIAAVNTLAIGFNDRLSAYNTDYAGAMDALVKTMGIDKAQLEHKPVAVIGAGGVSRAVVAGLTDAGAKVTIYNRTLSRAKKLASEFACHHASMDDIASLDAEIIVNCTSIGMYPDVNSSPLPASVLKKTMVVFDTVYNPAETLLLKQAKKAGAKTVPGVEMFIYQAMEQFTHFTGEKADESIMRGVIKDSL